MLGLVSLVFTAIANIVPFAIFRFVVARLLGLRGPALALELGIGREPWRNVSAKKRAAVVAAGPLGCYFFAAGLFTLSLLIGGKPTFDEHDMHVWVDPDGAAARGGMRGSDEIIAVAGTPIDSWTTLRNEVKKHANEITTVTARRKGTEMQLSVTVTDGRLGVIPKIRNEPVGFGTSIVSGVVAPVRLWGVAIRGIENVFRGRDHLATISMVRVVTNAARLTWAGFFELVGSITSFYFFVPIFFSLVMWPGLRKTRPALPISFTTP
ncbi:MAG: hypothetical protein ACRELY_12580 [Polyangiaceae bacterium]